MCDVNEWIAIIVGSVLIFVGCAYLFYFSPRIAKNQNNTISIVALRVSSWLVAGGLILAFLGVLHLMGIIPWWSSP